MGGYYRDLMSCIDRMGSGEWLIVVTIGVVIGTLCLRGLGSRSSY